MQVEKAPLESYADVGGLEQQIQEIKEAVELPLTHPELYEDIGIKPPKVGVVVVYKGGVFGCVLWGCMLYTWVSPTHHRLSIHTPTHLHMPTRAGCHPVW